VLRLSEPVVRDTKKPLQETVMTQYLVAIYHPDNYDPSVETEAMSREIDALNEEMMAAWVRIFVGGLSPAGSARSLRTQPSEVAEARVLEPAIWERLELALVAILALAVIVSVILFFAAMG
jgi:hypothetical protein